MPAKVITEILDKYATAPKSNMQALEDHELSIVFEHLTQNNQISNIAAIYADEPKKPEAPKVEAPKAEAPKAQPAAAQQTAKPAQQPQQGQQKPAQAQPQQKPVQQVQRRRAVLLRRRQLEGGRQHCVIAQVQGLSRPPGGVAKALGPLPVSLCLGHLDQGQQRGLDAVGPVEQLPLQQGPGLLGPPLLPPQGGQQTLPGLDGDLIDFFSLPDPDP